jgi:hypothetical protein
MIAIGRALAEERARKSAEERVRTADNRFQIWGGG